MSWMLLTKHEERSSDVDADIRDTEVHEEAERSAGAEHGRDDAEKPEVRLRLDPVAHHAGDGRESDHDGDCRDEKRFDRLRVLVQLLFHRSRRVVVHVQVLEL